MQTFHALLVRAALLVSVALCATTAFADESALYDPAPSATELLAEPIALRCSGMTIIEWRASAALGPMTGPTPTGIEVLNQLCLKALASYPAFLKKHALKFEKRDFTLSISMMGANTLLDGKAPRNLNDSAGRFKTTVPACCNWGVYVARQGALFMRNDPLIVEGAKVVTYKGFARTFLHELSHVLLHQWRVRKLQPYLTHEQDEGLAEEWARSLGYPYEAESSSEDRNNKTTMLRANAAANDRKTPR